MTRYRPNAAKKKTATKKTAKKAAKKKPTAKKKTVVVRKRAKPVLEDLNGLRQIMNGLRAENERLSDELSRTRAALAEYTDKAVAPLPPLSSDNVGLNLTKVIDEGAPKGTKATVVPAPAMDMFPAPAPVADKNLTRADVDGEAPAGDGIALVTPASAAAPEVGPEDPTEESDDDTGDDDDDGNDDSEDDDGVEDMDGPDREVA